MDEKAAATPNAGAGVETLEEIADDMLHLLERVAALEKRSVEIMSAVESVARSVQDTNVGLGRSLEATRRDLLEERKALAGRIAFGAVAGGLQSLRALVDSLDPAQDGRMLAQARSLISSLSGVVQSLGFSEFAPEVGVAFDPGRMECAGYADGEAGKVLAVCYPGYTAGETVVRAAGVRIADPAQRDQKERG
jgi:hypothetical protein